MVRILTEILILFGTLFLPGILWPGAGLLPENGGMSLYMVRFLVIAVPQILLILYVIRVGGGRPPEFGLRRASVRDIPPALLAFAALVAVLMVMNLAASLLPEADRFLSDGFRWQMESPIQIPLALLFSLATGYREELFFRSYLITRLMQAGTAPPAAVLLSALLFSAGHLYQGTAGLLLAVVQGLLFGSIFLRRRNLHVLALGHAFYNLAVLTLTVISPEVLPAGGIYAILR